MATRRVSIRTEIAVYNYICDYVLEHQYFPSMAEICEGAHYSSTQTPKHAIEQLVERGLLETDLEGRHARAYRVKEFEIRRKDNG